MRFYNPRSARSRWVAARSWNHTSRSAIALPLALTLCTSLLGALALATSAQAFYTHVFDHAHSPFAATTNQPIGVAVDNHSGGSASGDVYITSASGDVQRFNENGESAPFTASSPNISGNVLTGTPEKHFSTPLWIAVDPSGPEAGHFYVADAYGNNVIEEFDETGKYLGQFNIPNLFPSGVTIDPNHGPNGYLYATDRTNYHVEQFDLKTRELVSQFPANIGVQIDGIAVNSAGDVYVVDQENTVTGYNPSSEPPGEDLGVLDANGASAVAIDASTGDIYTYDNSGFHQYDSAGDPLETFSEAGVGRSYGIAVNTSTHVIYTTEYNENDANIFKVGTTLANAITNPALASEVGRESATVTGHLDPDSAHGGANITECKFEYVEEAKYNPGEPNPYSAGHSPVSCEQATPITTPTPVSAELSGLSGLTTYHYRVAATTANGTSYGADKIFTTPAVIGVETNPATEVRHGGAILHGEFNPEGLETHYHFEYGTEGNCAEHPCTSSPTEGPYLGSIEHVSLPLTHLKPEATYSFRIMANNKYGTTPGKNKEFTVPPAVKGVSTEAARNVGLTGATLNGSLDPDELNTEYHFEYGLNTEYGESTEIVHAGSTPGEVNVTPAAVTDLQPGHEYHYRLVATDSVGTTYGKDRTVETPSSPTIGSFSSSEVTANSAVLHAEINPIGVKTNYHFEYGTTSAYGETTAEGEITEELSKSHQVEVHLTALQAVTYHFRVVATSKWGTTTTEDQTFTFYPPTCPNSHVRQQTGAEFLPDCRAYELVSASNAGGATLFEGNYENDSPYAENTYAYSAGLGVIPGAGDPPNSNEDRYVATRTPAGWITKFVGVPANETADNGDTAGNISGDRFISTKKGQFFGGGVTFNAPILRDNLDRDLGQLPTNLAAVPGGDAGLASSYGEKLMSPDFSHFFFSSNDVAYAPGGITGVPGSAYDNDIEKGTVEVVSKTASGSSIPENPAVNWSGDYIQLVAASNEGSHLLMATSGTPANCYFNTCYPSRIVHLYMRVGGGLGVTHEIAPGHGVNYLGMTADGSKVFFTSNEDLTPEDTRHSTDLYMWSEAGEEEGKPLKVISLGNDGAGNSDACKPASGTFTYFNANGRQYYQAVWDSGCNIVPINSAHGFPGVSNGEQPPISRHGSDSSYASSAGDVYFYSPEQLDGSKGIPNEENLYVYREGQVHYVTTFEPGNYCEEYETCSNGPIGRINVSPDGVHMAFLSTQQLTGYENHGYAEIYTYDAASEELECVSCDPGGAPPIGEATASRTGLFMSNDGRTFFNTPDPLVSQDTDNLHDVYEYVDGRPQLISAGTSAKDQQVVKSAGFSRTYSVGLEGVSADGTNVFFSTFDTLVGQDENGNFVKIYDARTDGGFPYVPAVAPCEAADECHGPGSLPLPPAHLASSASLANGDAVTARAKKHRHQRGRRHHARRKVHHNRSRRRHALSHFSKSWR